MSRRKRSMVIEGGDETGLLLAGACLLHCLSVPLLARTWPAIGFALSRSTAWHQVFALLTVVVAGLILLPGYRVHKRIDILLLGLGGTALLAAAAAFSGPECCSAILAWAAGRLPLADVPRGAWFEFVATPCGCLLVGSAHWMNLKQSGPCGRQSQRRTTA